MEKKVIPTKHGIKCSKRDIVLDVRYVVNYKPFGTQYPFKTKLEAIETINSALRDTSISLEDFLLLKIQIIKL